MTIPQPETSPERDTEQATEARPHEDSPREEDYASDSSSSSYYETSVRYPYGDGDDRTTVTVATDAPDDFRPPLAIEYQPKQGGRYLGCCCDYRKAVIVLAAFTVATGCLDLIFYSIATAAQRARAGENESPTPVYDDDGLNGELDDLRAEYRIPSLWLEGLAVVFGIFMLLGALRFSRILLLLSVAGQMGAFAAKVVLSVEGNQDANSILADYDKKTSDLSYTYYGFLAVTGFLWWYPSLALVLEISKGIMTPETYAREEYSCLCAQR